MILGVGVDLVSVPRIERIIARSPRFLRRVYHPVEIEEANGRPDRFATRFAAKEAWLKAMALPLFTVPLTEVRIEIGRSGQPQLHLDGRAAELARERNVHNCHVSLSHTATEAVAVVVLEGEKS
ncbi:MAG: holo-ACP synthase [Candidatus Lernaella stagnicola]|nr:holo-ACP synthase [Candidatus Lernaella stagnicola]